MNFESERLESIFAALGARSTEEAVDPADCSFHAYLVELAGALATLPDDEIESATGVDVTYRARAELHNVVDFAEWVDDVWAANPSWQAAERFQVFLPAQSKILSGEKLYLYAAYLRRAMHGGERSGEIADVEDEELATVAGQMPALPNMRASPADRFAQAVRTLVEKRAQTGWPDEGTADVAIFVLVDHPRRVGQAHGGRPFADPAGQGTPLLGRLFFSSSDATHGQFIPIPTEVAAIMEWLEDQELAACPMVHVYRNAKQMVTRKFGIEDSARNDAIRDQEPSATVQELMEALRHHHSSRVLTPTNCPKGVWKPDCAHRYIPGPRPEKSIHVDLQVALNFWFRGVVKAEGEDNTTSDASMCDCSNKQRTEDSPTGSSWN